MGFDGCSSSAMPDMYVCSFDLCPFLLLSSANGPPGPTLFRFKGTLSRNRECRACLEHFLPFHIFFLINFFIIFLFLIIFHI